MSDNPPIEFAFPDLKPWEGGGAAPYVHVRDSGKPGPAVMVNALTHGNEVSGAIVVDGLLRQGLRPRNGKLILSFANIEAYHSFDPATPFKSRMVDEDFNRTWGRLDQPATTVERDYGGFGDPKSPKNALLIETGQHWRASSVVVAKDVAVRFLVESGIVDAGDLPVGWRQPAPPAQRVVEVTHAVATKHGNFKAARHFEGQEMIAKAGTLLGHDDDEPVTTPYDNCVLVMPSSNRPLRPGVTVVRLGRLV